MGLINLKFGKLKIPIYDLATISAGFYIGYNEGKGIYIDQSIEYLTKYGPTIFSLTLSPIIIKTNNGLRKLAIKLTKKNLEKENFQITQKDNSKIEYKNLDLEEKQEIKEKITTQMNKLESIVQNTKYLKPTLKVGTITAIESMVGYMAGRIYSQFS